MILGNGVLIKGITLNRSLEVGRVSELQAEGKWEGRGRGTSGQHSASGQGSHRKSLSVLRKDIVRAALWKGKPSRAQQSHYTRPGTRMCTVTYISWP